MRTIFGIVLVATMALAGWLAWVVLAPVQPRGETFVMLHPGFSTRRIAAELKSAGVIRNEQAFVFWRYISHRRSLKAGEYLFEQPANIIDIQKRLRRGDVYFHTVVVPEGFTMFDIAQAIEAAGLGPAQDFLKVAQTDTALVADIAPNVSSLEGFLFPDTYQFTRMMTMEEMAATMVKQFRQVAHQIGLVSASGQNSAASLSAASSISPYLEVEANNNPGSADALPNDVERIVTMASIIEKETSVPDERALIASVYYNRLSRKIALDADPSIIYAELLAGTYTGALHHPDMRFDSPYNTYRHIGLPPGPIANPGKTSLEAAMHPAQSDYYYFVADAQGHHRFAHTLEEHDKNVAAYRRAMRGQ